MHFVMTGVHRLQMKLLFAISLRHYSPRATPKALLPIISHQSKLRRTERKAIIDAVLTAPTDPDADAPFTPFSARSLLVEPETKVMTIKRQKATRENIIKVLEEISNKNCSEFPVTALPDSIVIMAEVESTRRRWAELLTEAFDKVTVEPGKGVVDGGWTCCLVDDKWFVHFVDQTCYQDYELNREL